MKRNWSIYFYLLFGFVWILIGLVRGYGDFMAAYDFIHPSPIDFSKYSDPTVSAKELAQMRNGLGALVACAIGILSLLTAGGHFLKGLTAPVLEESEKQTDERRAD